MILLQWTRCNDKREAIIVSNDSFVLWNPELPARLLSLITEIAK